MRPSNNWAGIDDISLSSLCFGTTTISFFCFSSLLSFFSTQRHKETMYFSLSEDTMSSFATFLQRPQSSNPNGFVATFKSLVVFVSKENLRSFVSLCFIIPHTNFANLLITDFRAAKLHYCFQTTKTFLASIGGLYENHTDLCVKIIHFSRFISPYRQK